MAFAIDHIVICSDDLETAIANARKAGFTVVPGGVHGSGVSQNALIAFADGAYLELFAPTPEGRSATHRWFGRIRKGGGLVDFCLLGGDLAAEVARIRRAGLQYSAPFAMSRRTPEGTTIEWLLSTPPGATGEAGWPFMIEDTTPRPIRVPHASEQLHHRNGAHGVAGITVLVRDIDASSKAFEAILDTAPRAAPAGDARSALFSIQGAWVELREPGSFEEKAYLERFGQGPYRVILKGAKGGGQPKDAVFLDAALFSGAKVGLA